MRFGKNPGLPLADPAGCGSARVERTPPPRSGEMGFAGGGEGSQGSGGAGAGGWGWAASGRRVPGGGGHGLASTPARCCGPEGW